ncbi:MAG: PAS domain S-box protein [Syntrophorhabdaceae bacterium]
MKNPASPLPYDPDDLAQQCAESLKNQYRDSNRVFFMASILARALSDSIETRNPDLFLNSINSFQENTLNIDGSACVYDIILAIEERAIEWKLESDDSKFLWTAFHRARRKSGNKLNESERKFRDLAELMPQVIFEIDEKGTLIFVNKQAYSFFGYEEKDFDGPFCCFDHVVPEDFPRIMINMRKVAEGYTSPGNEYTGIKKDGTRFPIVIYLARILTNDRVEGYRGIIIDITERKRTEERLRAANKEIEEREDMYRTFFDSTTDFVFLKDEELRYVLANKAYLEFFGKGAGEVFGQNDFELMPAEDAANCRATDMMALQAGRVVINAEPMRDRIYETLKFPVRTGPNKTGVGGFVRDITERKRSEDVLLQGERRLRQIIDLVPHFIFAKDIEGRFVLANKAVAETYGTNVEGIIGKIDPRLITSENKTSEFYDDLEVINQGVRKYIPEESIVDSRGNMRYLQTVKIPFTFSGTQSPSLLGVSVDITDRKMATEALRKSEEKFRRYFDVPLIGVTILDPSGNWLEVNDKFCDMTGYSREELLRMKWQDITSPDDLSSEFDSYVRFMDDSSSSIVTREKVYIRKDGDAIDVIIATHCVRKDDGTADYLLCVIQDITLRKNAERKIVKSEHELRTIITASPIGIGKIRDRVMEWVNEALCAITGYDRHELTDQTTRFLYNSDAEYERIGRDLYRDGQVETRWIRKDRILIDILLQVAPTEGGAFIYTASDITRLKIAESALKFTQFSVDRAGDSVYWIDSEGRIAYVNDSACNSTGYDREEMLALTIYELDRGCLANAWPQFWADIVEKGSAQFESMYRRKDGSAFPVEMSTSYLSYDGFRYICAFVRDITERKNSQEALQESEDRWQFALEGSGDGVFDWNPLTGKVYFSKQWKEMLGYADEDIGDSIEMWERSVHPEDKKDVYRRLNDHLQRKTPVYIAQYRSQCRDGSHKWLLARGKVIAWTEDERPLRMIGTHTDITERKQLESQLVQSQKMEAVGTLAGGVAHDFNNLLSAIMGYASLLQMKMEKSNPLYAYASHILTSSEKAANLTQSLLAFSRKQVINLKPLMLNDTVEKLHRLLERLIPEDVEFTVKTECERLVVMADSGQLDQVIMNLVTNARDAMPRGGKLSIRVAHAAQSDHIPLDEKGKPGDFAVIEISDTGTGMDKKTIEKIFEPFYTTKEVGRGTGLGLSIVYGIVKQHNGFIDVQSETGKGSVFSVYLPLVWMEPEEESDNTRIVGGIETILIAEDNKELCQLSMRVLRDHGYTVLAARDGSMAVELFREHKGNISLVILDVVMPKMNGKEAFDVIRKMDPSMKFIFTSGYTDDIIIERGFENEEYDFLGKPITPATLLKKIREVLDRR